MISSVVELQKRVYSLTARDDEMLFIIGSAGDFAGFSRLVSNAHLLSALERCARRVGLLASRR